MKLTLGKHYFVVQTRRTDQFAHKRHTTPALVKTESTTLEGELVEHREGQVKLRLSDGEEFVFRENDLLTVAGGDYRTVEDHGEPDSA